MTATLKLGAKMRTIDISKKPDHKAVDMAHVRDTFAPELRDFIRDVEYNTGKMTADQWASMCADFVVSVRLGLTALGERQPEDAA